MTDSAPAAVPPGHKVVASESGPLVTAAFVVAVVQDLWGLNSLVVKEECAIDEQAERWSARPVLTMTLPEQATMALTYLGFPPKPDKKIERPKVQPGDVFHYWTVVEFVARNPRRWHCKCKCGREGVVDEFSLIRSLSKSCRCRAGKLALRHGMSRTLEHKTWISMKQRCHNPRHKAFCWYGGRGIYVCDRWRVSFEAFLEDMGLRPGPGYSIDRIDADGHYEPSNCRWATKREQSLNLRSAAKITAFGRTCNWSDWTRETGHSWQVLHYRLKRGLTIEQALSLPVLKPGQRFKKVMQDV